MTTTLKMIDMNMKINKRESSLAHNLNKRKKNQCNLKKRENRLKGANK